MKSFNAIKRWLGKSLKPSQRPLIIPRSQHTITRKAISPQALKVLYRLKKHKHAAYLVGGGVRDLLLDKRPKDFDIATSAHPEEVKRTFTNCRLIGRRFRLAHIHFGREIIEVATFRSTHTHESQEGLIIRDNVYGTLEDDVSRRDFTINALYYNIKDFSLVDYFGGLKDLKSKVVRIIGNPEQRFREDPVRMLRAVRFEVQLGFTLEHATKAPIQELSPLLAHIAPARLFDEYIKLFLKGAAFKMFHRLKQLYLFKYLFPQVQGDSPLIEAGLKNTDDRIANNQSISPAFLPAVLLWGPLQKSIQERVTQHAMPQALAFEQAVEHVLRQQQKTLAIPRRLSQTIRDIWHLQHRLVRHDQRRVESLIAHPKFKAAYDFLLLRAQAGEKLAKSPADWWTQRKHQFDKQDPR